MELKLVTFETDLTQFLVEADNYADAIQFAMDANREYGNTTEIMEDVEDVSNYSVEDVSFNLLSEMFLREDCCGRCAGAIVFND